jgi:hypothetical protein
LVVPLSKRLDTTASSRHSTDASRALSLASNTYYDLF